MGKKSKRRGGAEPSGKWEAGEGGPQYYYAYAGDEEPAGGWLSFASRLAANAMTVALVVAALVSQSMSSLFPTRAEAERNSYRTGASAAGGDPGASSSGYGRDKVPPPPPVDHFAVLGLVKSVDLTEAEVRTAFRKLSLTCHPDKCAPTAAAPLPRPASASCTTAATPTLRSSSSPDVSQHERLPAATISRLPSPHAPALR